MDAKSILLLIGLTFVVLMIIEPTRKHILQLGAFLTSESSYKILTFLIFFWKKVFSAHLRLVKHLLTPRSTILKSLDDD